MPQLIPVISRPQRIMTPGQPRLYAPQQQLIAPPMGSAQRIQTIQSYPQQNLAGQMGWLNGLGGYLGDTQEDQQPMAPQAAYGLPPQDLINSLYDIFGAYPRKNVLPYAFSFNLLSSQGTAVTAGGTSRPSIKITADAAMIATLITGASTGEYSIFMRTDSSDRQLMIYPIHSAAMVGTAERPFPLPKPLLLAPNTTLSFDITDLSGATNEIWFTLWGFKVYRRQYAAAG
jgi:hypothetical protein